MRQYALEKLGESDEADAVRARHRDHYTAMAALLDAPARTDYEQRVEQAEIEIDNLRAAFGWSRENSDVELALALASSLQLLWLARGRIREGLAWFDAVLTDLDAHHLEVAAAVRTRALADKAVLGSQLGDADEMAQAQQALALAREIDDPALLARALTACGFTAATNAELAQPYFAEAIGLAREIGDGWRLSQILVWQATAAIVAGDPSTALAAAEEARGLADAIGDRVGSRQCRVCLGWSQLWQGDLAGAAAEFGALAAEAGTAHDGIIEANSLAGQCYALAWQGDTSAAGAKADAALQSASELGAVYVGVANMAVGLAALATGDHAAAGRASEAAWQHLSVVPGSAGAPRALSAEAALASGDLIAARRLVDEAVTIALGWQLVVALTTRARVAIAQAEPDQAERDARDALAIAASIQAYLGISDTPGVLRRSGR